MPALVLTLLAGLALAVAGHQAVHRRADGPLAAVVVLAVGWLIAVPAVLRGPPANEIDEEARLRARIAPAVAAMRQIVAPAGVTDCRIDVDHVHGQLCWEGSLSLVAASRALSSELSRIGAEQVRPRCIQGRVLACEITALLQGERFLARVHQVRRPPRFSLYGGLDVFGLVGPLPDGTPVPVPFTPSP